MTPTVPYLEERFDTFNRMCFDGVLPRIPIKLSRARSFVGRLQYRIVRDRLRRIVRKEDFILRISICFDLPEAEVEDTLIHEMIHYFIAWKGLQDNSTHGRLFRAMMQEINAHYGRHLSISHKSSPADLARDTRVREHELIVSELADGRSAVTVCARSYGAALRRAISRAPAVRSLRCYRSRDPWFNRFPRCRTPKVFPVDPAELQTHLSDAEMLKSSE